MIFYNSKLYVIIIIIIWITCTKVICNLRCIQIFDTSIFWFSVYSNYLEMTKGDVAS